MMGKESFGFIGCGNMGGALASAVCRAVGGERVLVCDRDEAKTGAIAAKFGAIPADIHRLAQEADFLFFGVKPQMLEATVESVREELARRGDRTVLVTMAAGVTLTALEGMLGYAAKIVRIMPNTPVSVGEGLILYSANSAVSDGELSTLLHALSAGGKTVPIAEEKIDAASAVSGCGPAFAYLFIEALADGGVECGLSRSDAQAFAAQMVLGAAKTVLGTGRHPGELKDAVCSPGGTTIVGVRALEERGFRAAASNAVIAAYRKTLELKK